MQPLTVEEVRKVYEYTVAIIRGLGLSTSLSYNIIFLEPEKLREVLKKRTTIEIEDGVYVDPNGLVVVRSDLLANVAVRKIMIGIISLALIENFGDVQMDLVSRLVDKYYDKVLVYLYC